MKKNIFVMLFSAGLFVSSLFFINSCNKYPHVTIDAAQVEEKDSPTSIKVFLENSGSMDGYMCPGSELKDDIYNYLTFMKGNRSKLELNYINTQIVKQPSSLSQYIRNLNPTSFRQSGGNRAYTNISDLFSKVLASVDSSSVAIYISDCILDIPNHAAPNFLNITRTDINGVFRDKLAQMKDLSVCIYQLQSSFQGNYYFPKGGAQQYEGKLPYYMFMIGPRCLLSGLRESVSDDKITHGVNNYCAFTPYFNVSAQLSQGGKNLDDIELRVVSQDVGGYDLSVMANLHETLQSNDFLVNPSNYSNVNPERLKLKKIYPIKKKDQYSHILEFHMLKEAFSDKVQLKNAGVPKWVVQSSDSKGDTIHSDKTFGLEYLVGGIADAYSNEYITNFKLNIILK